VGLKFVVLPVLGAFIGWLTNHLAITFLFRPHRPLWGQSWLQGVIPKNRRRLTQTIAEQVERELVSSRDIGSGLDTPANRARLAESVAAAVSSRAAELLPPLLPGRGFILRELHAYVREQARRWLDAELEQLLGKVVGGLDVAGMVNARLEALKLGDLEDLVRAVAGAELRVIELTGAVLGALIGLLQAVLVHWWG
jgi:uncharacterized membrane protein YheB (UPF0754 family)